jgi:glycosyltransferase involved in cell wall biosynthesis
MGLASLLENMSTMSPQQPHPPSDDRRSGARHVRVAFLNPSLDRGYYCQPLFRAFTKLFPNTLVFTGLWQGFLPGYEGTFTVRVLPGVKFVSLQRGPNGYGKGFIWAPPSILWPLWQFRPQVIFTSGFDLWTLYALAFKAYTHCRMILLWDGISPTVSYLEAPIRLRIRQMMARFLDACASNTREGADYLRDVLGVSESKLTHHPYLVPEMSLFRSATGGEKVLASIPRPAFIYIGRLIEPKGWRHLLVAASQLVQSGMTSFSVVFIGAGSQADELRQHASILGLEKIVYVVGPVCYEALSAYLRACDVLVHPTLEDVWAMVVLEAMACGKPVLCSRYAGAKEMIQPGANGFIFDPYNPGELASYMERFIQEPSLIVDFGVRSREIIAPYSPKRAADVLADMAVKFLRPTAGREALYRKNAVGEGH